MKIAFYAPLKPISSPKPSGDRLIGRLFKKAMERSGHDVSVVSTFRSYDGKGDHNRQSRLQKIGLKKADLLARQLSTRPPDLWFTYHLYRKAPDWLGPRICRQLNIPYVVAEASVAPSQAAGDWALGYKAVQDALSLADLVIGTTVADEACVLPELTPTAHYFRMKPFLNTAPFADAGHRRASARSTLQQTHNLNPDVPWLLTVAMMRPGVKFDSYQVLATALRQCLDTPWQLIVVGDGTYRDKVRGLFADFEDRITWLGEMPEGKVASLYAASDFYVWPSVRESPGMTFLEAQASGLPVVGGDGGGVPDVIENGVGGFLTAKRDANAFADRVQILLHDPARRRTMGQSAIAYVQKNHTLDVAAGVLNNGFLKVLS